MIEPLAKQGSSFGVSGVGGEVGGAIGLDGGPPPQFKSHGVKCGIGTRHTVFPAV